MGSREWIEIEAERLRSSALAHRLKICGRVHWVPRSICRPSPMAGHYCIQHWWLKDRNLLR